MDSKEMRLLIEELKLAEQEPAGDYYFTSDDLEDYPFDDGDVGIHSSKPRSTKDDSMDGVVGAFLETNKWVIVQLVWYCVSVVLIVVANALLLATIRKVRYLKTTLNRYVASLSVCDLVVALYALVKVAGLCVARLGSNLYFCLGMHLGWICVTTVAQVMVVYIAFDCYFSIWHPIGYARAINSWRASVAIFLAWIYAGAVSLLPLIWFVKWTSSICHIEQLVEDYYIIFLMVHYAVCVLIVVIVYLCVYYEIRTKKVIIQVFQRRERQRQLYEDRRKRDVHNANCMAIMSMVFFITWLPYFFVLAVHAFIIRMNITTLLETSSLLLAVIHSSFNPLIYLCRLETFQIACYKGVFRLSCEYVIKTMRRGRETLLTLLEAFVYDPLVDWTTGNEGAWLTGAFNGGGEGVEEARVSKREMERDITRSMFSIRVAEMRAAWAENRQEMVGALTTVGEAVNKYMEAEEALQEAQAGVDALQLQRGYLDDAREEEGHEAYTLPHRYKEHVLVNNTRQQTIAVLLEKMKECSTWHVAHKYALDMIGGPKFQKLCSDVSQISTGSDLSSCFTPVLDFLQSAGQANLASQCEAVSEKLANAQLARHSLLKQCLDLLHTYATIVSHFPKKYVDESRDAHWSQWLESLHNNLSSSRCQEIVTEFHENYGASQVMVEAGVTLSVHARLGGIIQDTNNRLVKMLERRTAIGVETSYLALQVATAISDVEEFIRQHGDSGAVCMTSVVVTALCSLNKRYLVMEQAAAAAGDRLMDLTSRDGDWFLDELHSMSGNVNHLLGMLNNALVSDKLRPGVSQQLSTAMSATHAVYSALSDLYANFRQVIVPEACKTLQSGETSVETVVTGLLELEATGQIDSLMAQLESQLLNAIMGMQTDEAVMTQVRQLRGQYDQLLHGENTDVAQMTPGQMLLMGFHGLFSRLDEDFRHMIETVSKHEVVPQWRKMDVIKEARSLQLNTFNHITQPILSQLYFLKQLRAMTTFFTHVAQMARVLNSEEDGACYDDDQLSKPIKKFIADFLRKNVIGLPSQTLGYVLCEYMGTLNIDVTAEIELRDIGAEVKVSLEELCKKAVDCGLKNGLFQHLHLTQASAVIGASDTAWRKSDLASRLDMSIEMMRSSLQRAQLMMTRFSWLHEDIIPDAAIQPISRTNVMAQMRTCVGSLLTAESAMREVQEQHQGLEASISQRLKWAAGANHMLHTVLVAFEEAVSGKTDRLRVENSCANDIVTVCNAILHLEALHTATPEAITADANFLTLVSTTEESCKIMEQCTSTVTQVEEAIILATPTEAVTVDWMAQATKNIDRESTRLGRGMGALRATGDATRESVRQAVTGIRATLTTHHTLMSDVRSILRSMAKQEEQEDGGSGEIRQYMDLYKSFSENLTSMLRLALTDPITLSVNNEVATIITSLSEQLGHIYGDLLQFAPPLESVMKAESEDANAPNFATVLKRGDAPPPPPPSSSTTTTTTVPSRLASSTEPDLLSGGGAGNSPHVSSATKISSAAPVKKVPEKVTRDPKTGKAVQERNSYAVSVWRRVKAKLDGRDPDTSKRLTVPEQVDYVVKEAVNCDNLSLLYEGWTPWV